MHSWRQSPWTGILMHEREFQYKNFLVSLDSINDLRIHLCNAMTRIIDC